MAKAKKTASKTKKKPIEQYDHKGKKRVNNPPVGLVTPVFPQNSLETV
jgi:adenine-specific DNA-methyltransferase